jgi:four helix bundle protein
MARTFYDLDIWKKGHELLIVVYKVTSGYPPEEKYGISNDTKRSANSVIANIAEAHGRYFFANKIRVLYIARGEVEETHSHLKVAESLGYIPTEKFQWFDRAYEGLAKGISSYITSLDKQSNRKT